MHVVRLVELRHRNRIQAESRRRRRMHVVRLVELRHRNPTAAGTHCRRRVDHHRIPARRDCALGGRRWAGPQPPRIRLVGESQERDRSSRRHLPNRYLRQSQDRCRRLSGHGHRTSGSAGRRFGTPLTVRFTGAGTHLQRHSNFSEGRSRRQYGLRQGSDAPYGDDERHEAHDDRLHTQGSQGERPGGPSAARSPNLGRERERDLRPPDPGDDRQHAAKRPGRDHPVLNGPDHLRPRRDAPRQRVTHQQHQKDRHAEEEQPQSRARAESPQHRPNLAFHHDHLASDSAAAGQPARPAVAESRMSPPGTTARR